MKTQLTELIATLEKETEHWRQELQSASLPVQEGLYGKILLAHEIVDNLNDMLKKCDLDGK